MYCREIIPLAHHVSIYMVSKTKSKMSRVHNHLLHSIKKHQLHQYEEDNLQEIEVLIISAEILKNVRFVTKMRPYAVVYVEKEVHVAETQTDKRGGTDPTWNEIVKVKVRKEVLEDSTDVRAALNVDIYDRGHVREKPVGSARVLLCNVLNGGKPDEPVDNPIQCMTVQVWRPSGRPQGLLNLWVPPTGRFLTRRNTSSLSGKDGLVVEVDKDEEAV